MSGFLQRLANRLGLRSLRQQLTLLFALLLTLSVCTYALYTGFEQAAYVEHLERTHANELTRQLATALEPHVAAGDPASITRHLLDATSNPALIRLTVINLQGVPLASVHRPESAAPLTAEPDTPFPIPLPDQDLPTGSITPPAGLPGSVDWVSIGEATPTAWLRSEIHPAAANDSLRRLLRDSAVAALLTLVASTATILIFLRPPLHSLEKAAAFAEGMETRQGDTLIDPAAAIEIRKLVDALNRTSIRLFDGQSALAASELRNRTIAEAALDSIITVDAQGHILEFNPAAERTFGISRADALHQPASELLFPESLRDTHAAKLQQRLERQPPETGEQRIETRAKRHNGEEFPVEVALVAVDSGGSRLITAYLRDISERKEAERIMRQAKESAEANSRSKSDFLANMSHEIRTPMNAILGMTDLALETELDEEQKEYLTLVRSSANSLLGIINDILDFSKIEAGKLDFEHINFSLRDCVALAVRTLQQRASEKDLQLSVQVAPEAPDSLIGDPHRLRQVLINLISNAIKFTNKGSIRVIVQPGGSVEGKVFIQFSVQDTGVGIPAEKQGLIFEAFSQADTSTTRRYGGTGLGLTISAQLVQAMGGQIHVDSTPGQGSRFHFSAGFEPGHSTASIEEQAHLEGLPVLVAVDNTIERNTLIELLGQWRMSPTCVPDASACLRELAQATRSGFPYRVVVLGTQLPDSEGFSLAESITRSDLPQPCMIMLAGEGRRGDGARCRELGIAAYLPMPVEASDLLNAILLSVDPIDERPLITRHSLREQRRQLRILLAEDNVVNQTLAMRLLAKLGHHVEVANNGQEALTLHAAGHFDAILMDVQMPVMGGFEATAAIREREAAGAARTPIIAMTAHAMKGDRERCLQAGMDGYLSKPVHAPDLVEVLIRYASHNDPAPAPEAESPTHSGPIFDREQILANLGDDEDLLAQLMTMYSEDEPRLLADVEAAVAAGDAEALYGTAHTLKGAVSNFCASRAQAKAQQLERMGREKKLEQAAAGLAELKLELIALRDAFKQH